MSELPNNPCKATIQFEDMKQGQLVHKFEVKNVVTKQRPPRRNPWGNSSYADLITQAIETSPEKKLTLAEIYDWMIRHVPYFKNQGASNSSAGWKNSIRHNLSLHKKFLKLKNETSNGKSSWWTVTNAAGSGRTTRRKKLYRRKKNQTSYPYKAEILRKIKTYSHTPSNSPTPTSNESSSTNFGWNGNIRYNLPRLISDFPNDSLHSGLPNSSQAFGFCRDRTCNAALPGYDLSHQPVPIRTYPLPFYSESSSNSCWTSNYHSQGLDPLQSLGNEVHGHYNREQNALENETLQNTTYSVFDNDENLCLNVSREYFKSRQHLSGSYLNLYKTSSYKSDSIWYLSVGRDMYNFNPTASRSSKSCSSRNTQQMSFNSQNDGTGRFQDAIKVNENVPISADRRNENNSIKIFHPNNYTGHKPETDFKKEEDFYSLSKFSTTDEELDRISELISGKFIKSEIYDVKDEEDTLIYLEPTTNDISTTNRDGTTINKAISEPKEKAFYFCDSRDLKYILSCENSSEYRLSFVHRAGHTSTKLFSLVSIVFNYKNSLSETSSSTEIASEKPTLSLCSCRIGYSETILQPSDVISITNISTFEELSCVIDRETINIYCLLLVIVNIILLRVQVISNSKDFVEGIVTRINKECAIFSLKQILCYLTEFFFALSNLYNSFLQNSLFFQLRKKAKDLYPVPPRSFPDINCAVENYFKVLNQKITASYSEKMLSEEKMTKFKFPPDVIEFLSSYTESTDRINIGIVYGTTGHHLKMLNIISLETLNQFCQTDSLSNPEQLKNNSSPDFVFLNSPPRSSMVDRNIKDCDSGSRNLGNIKVENIRMKVAQAELSNVDFGEVFKKYCGLLNLRMEQQSDVRNTSESSSFDQQTLRNIEASVLCKRNSSSIENNILIPNNNQTETDFSESIETSQLVVTNNSTLRLKNTENDKDGKSEVAHSFGSENERIPEECGENLDLDETVEVILSSLNGEHQSDRTAVDIPEECGENLDLDEIVEVILSSLNGEHQSDRTAVDIPEECSKNLDLDEIVEVLRSSLNGEHQSDGTAVDNLCRYEVQGNKNCESTRIDVSDVLPADLEDIKLSFDAPVFSENSEMPSDVFEEYDKEFDGYL